jgi:predicted RNA binding protein YcfA (HicA-like mRNA interferase family)
LPKLPAASGEDVIRALERAGFEVLRQRGSHVILVNRQSRQTIPVPVHGQRDLPAGTLRGIIADAGLTVGEFVRLLSGGR